MYTHQQIRFFTLCVALSFTAACKSKPADSGSHKGNIAAQAPAKPIFEDALQAVLNQKAPQKADNKPYGCSVKYAADAPAPTQVAQVGQAAPDFELQDLQGKSYKLSELKGKTVILEWYNPQCPFVEYAYNEGPLRGRAKKSDDKVLWLNINSGAPGKQGSGKELNIKLAQALGVTQPVLLDESGTVGRTYGAKTTPQMFIIDDKGVLVYRGALDNAPLGKVKG